MLEVAGLKEFDLYDGKVALVTSDPGSIGGQTFAMNPEVDDCTSYYYWVEIWRGHHYSYAYLEEKGYSDLLKYSVVILQGDKLFDVIKIAKFLKGKVVTMLWPEYALGMRSINEFYREEYESWKSVDVIMNWEETTNSCYSTLSGTPSHFVYVPIREVMSQGAFLVSLDKKQEFFVVYGDNNLNNPMISAGVAKRMGKPITTVAIPEVSRELLQELFGVTISGSYPKIYTYPYLRLMGQSKVHVYPNNRVGTNREQVACAAVGTPCIGNMMSNTQKRLFPKLAVDYRDVDSMVALAKKLYEDTDYYKEIVDYAWNQLPFYSVDACKRRFMECYLIGKGRCERG